MNDTAFWVNVIIAHIWAAALALGGPMWTVWLAGSYILIAVVLLIGEK